MIARRILQTSAVQFGTLFLGIISGVFITRLLGPEGRGVYAVLNANTDFLVLFLGFGLGSVTTFYASSREIPTGKLLGLAVLGSGVGMASVTLLLLTLPYTGLQSLALPDNYEGPWFRLYLFVAFAFNLAGAVFSGFLNGRKRFTATNLAKISTVASLLIAAALLYWQGGVGSPRGNLVAVLTITLATGLFNLLLLSTFFVRMLKDELAISFNVKDEAKLAGRFVSLVYLGELINFVNYRLDIWLVEHFRNSYQVGLYSLAVSASQLLSLIAVPVTIVLLPHLNDPSERGEARRLFVAYSRVTFTLSLAAALTLFALAGFLVPFVYGVAFQDSVLSLRLLLAGALFSSVAKVMSVYVVTQGKMLYNVVAVSVGVVVTLIMDIALIPRYGIEGASIATSASYLAILIVLISVLRYRLKLVETNYYFLDLRDLKLIAARMKAW